MHANKHHQFTFTIKKNGVRVTETNLHSNCALEGWKLIDPQEQPRQESGKSKLVERQESE